VPERQADGLGPGASHGGLLQLCRERIDVIITDIKRHEEYSSQDIRISRNVYSGTD
jgi:hypothetical protein